MNVPDDILVAREKYLKAKEDEKLATSRVVRILKDLEEARTIQKHAQDVLEQAQLIARKVSADWILAERPL